MPHLRRDYSLTCQYRRQRYVDNGISYSGGFSATALTPLDRFCSLFYNAIPAEYHLRVWDVFLFEGNYLAKSTFIDCAHDSEPFRGSVFIPRWSGAVNMLPRSLVGGSKPRPRTFHLV